MGAHSVGNSAEVERHSRVATEWAVILGKKLVQMRRDMPGSFETLKTLKNLKTLKRLKNLKNLKSLDKGELCLYRA